MAVDNDNDDDDDDLYLDDIRRTPGGPFLPYVIGDLVQINSDPEDEEKESHLHCGYITKQTQEQITIKKDTEMNSYFVDEISIKLIHKGNEIKTDIIETQVQPTESIQPESKTAAEIEIKTDRETALDAVDIKRPQLYAKDDLFFNHFDTKDHHKELEEENVAVRNLFRDNANDDAMANANAINILSRIPRPPLQSKTNSFEHTQPVAMTMAIPEPENIHQSYSHSHGVLSRNAAMDTVESFECFECKKPIMASDWTKSNVQQMSDKKWKHLVCTCYLFVDKYVSTSNGNSNSNAIADESVIIMEVMLRLQMKQPPNSKLLEEISNLKATTHAHANSLEKVNDFDFDLSDWGKVVNESTRLNDKESALITNTKQQETILMHCNDENEVIVYDSHPRRKLQLNTPHILIFNDKHKAELYVQQLWPQNCNECHLTLFALTDDDDDEMEAVQLEKVDPKTRQYIERLLNRIKELKDEMHHIKSQINTQVPQTKPNPKNPDIAHK